MSSFLGELNGSLESLSDIEGYEFLSDLDAGFEEELKSLGVGPGAPTAAKPGSEEKVMMLAARYAAGLPLWHNDDDIVIPKHFKHMHGIHAYTKDGMTIACDYFVVYEKQVFDAARAETGVGVSMTSVSQPWAGNWADLRMAANASKAAALSATTS